MLEGWAQSTEEIPYVGGAIAGLLRGVAAVPVEGNIDIAGIEIPVTWIYALGGLLILLLIWRVWKRRQDDEYDDEGADWPEPGGSGDSGAASVSANDPLSGSGTAATISGSGGTSEANVSPESIGSGFVVQAEAARGVSVTTDEVDPLAEADLYAAYGRVEQALVVLRSAIREAPDRLDYKIKLLEVLAQHGDVAAFETLAEEVQLLVDKRSDEWKTIVGLGRGLNPGNPLFAAAGAAQEDSPSAQPSAAEKASEAAGGLDLDAELEAMFGEDDSNEAPVIAAPLPMPAAEIPAEPVSGSDTTPVTDEALSESEEVVKVETTDSMELDFESPSVPNEVESAVEEAVETAPEETSVDEVSANEIAFELDDVTPLVSSDDTAGQGDAVTVSTTDEQEAEMEGKLDLARAYVEIGDKEAAQELIEEVLKTGSSVQQEVAAQLRQSLDNG